MKKTLLTTAVLLLALSAGAQYRESQTVFQRLIWDDEKLNILLDTRFDGHFSTGNSDGKHLGFEAAAIKIWVAGEIVPGIRYRVRHRLNKPQTPLRDNTGAATDHAWLAFDIGRQKKWTITAGKQSVQFGTFEFDYNTADIYLSTLVNHDVDSYKMGVNVAYRFAGQVLNVQVVNSDATQFAREDYANKVLGGTILWEGDLLGEVIKTRWAYSAFQHTKTKFYNWATLGLQINIDSFTTELDYYYGERNMDYGAQVGKDDLGLRFVHDQSVSLNLKYNFGKWRPFVKGTWNRRQDVLLGEDPYRSWGIQAVVEYYPFKQKLLQDLRFHLAYYYSDTGYRGIWSNHANDRGHNLMTGLRWLFKAK